MAENSGIAWTNHTFNPWRGCTKVSSGCRNCYAEKLAKRNPDVLGIWGDEGTRVASKAWKDPVKWNKRAGETGVREKVFVGSMCDVMEDREELSKLRWDLWILIEKTPNLDWLLLSKRPENYRTLLPPSWMRGRIPRNVWIGATVEHDKVSTMRIEYLARIPAAVRFLSVEPLVGPVNLGLMGTVPKTWGLGYTIVGSVINWVIVGAESGPGRRMMDRDWARSIRDECVDAGVPFFYKQEIGEDGKKIETPKLDGKRWIQTPSDPEFFENAYM